MVRSGLCHAGGGILGHAMTKILLVEQDTVLRGLMRSCLERAGHDVVAVPKARDALRCRAAGVVADLIITDVDCRGNSTIDYTDALVGHAGDVPVLGIVQTRYVNGFPVPSHRARTLGVTDTLVQPFSNQAFLGAVDRLLVARTA